MKTNKTAVIFRTFKSGGDVIALFPFEPATNDGWLCNSYQHIGQHGGACPSLMRVGTRQATPKESSPLAKELRAIGYNLRELKRFPSKCFQRPQIKTKQITQHKNICEK